MTGRIRRERWAPRPHTVTHTPPLPPLRHCLPLPPRRFMTIGTKAFAKKVACAPETISAADFETFTTLFGADEKVHIAMLASEARRQAALLYGLAAVMRHMGGEGER
jgi:hypothetical protein